VADPARPFSEETLHALLDLIAARTPTPGGGTVAAVAGALGAALGCMAIRFSEGRKDSTPGRDAVLGTVAANLLGLVRAFERLADEDSAAYERVRDARRMPQNGDAEKSARAEALAGAIRTAADVPLKTARLCRDGLELLDGASSAIHRNLATDAASGAFLFRAGARAAALNVRVNLGNDATPEAAAALEELGRILRRCEDLERRLDEWVGGIVGRA
jgi:formiminotetrahydrofolate cyclodeaminase